MNFLLLLTILVSIPAYASSGSFEQLIKKSFSPRSNCEIYLKKIFVPMPEETSNGAGCIDASIELTDEALLIASRNGIFSWGSSGRRGYWCTPPERGVLNLNNLRIPARDLKYVRALERKLHVTRNRDFKGVIEGCALKSRTTKNWISPELQAAYVSLFRRGYARSYEVWDGDYLVAGLYGTLIDGVFSGESIFNLPDHPNAGKLALFSLLQDAKASGYKFIDVQQNYEGGLLHKWGAQTVSRSDYVTNYLRPAQAANLSLVTAPQMQ